MKVLILGIDGYLGWPTALAFSRDGHEIFGVDNYLRRNLSRDLDVEPLFQVPNLHERVKLWEQISGKSIKIAIGDLKEWTFISKIFEEFKPEVIIHYAEQPSAPFSMLNRESATLTIQNNLMVTTNVIFAVRQFCPNAHLIKLGTMGEYGTPNIDIEEGWLDIRHNGREERFLYPRQASSLYHTTKIMDTDLLWFYVRMWGLKVTDLMQGPVYGFITEETKQDDRLLPFFNYDEIFGTVVNRFLVQAVAGYPLTVYGKGGQTRGYINLKDTINCIRISMNNPPRDNGELRIFNQITETFTVNELAEKVKLAGQKLGIDVKVNHVPNPRKEAEEHYYKPKYTGLKELGLEPCFLSREEIVEMIKVISNYKDQISKTKITKNVKWNNT